MKNLFFLIVIASTIFFGCKKEEVETPEINVVQYRFECTDCVVTYDVKGGQKTQKISGEVRYTEKNELSVVNVTATGTGDVKVVVILDDIIKCYASKWLGNGTVTFNVPMR